MRWTDGALIDLERVGARARELGALFTVDLTQSLGAMPFNLIAVRPDFLVATGYKWLLGPFSLAYLWVVSETALWATNQKRRWIPRYAGPVPEQGEVRCLVCFRSWWERERSSSWLVGARRGGGPSARMVLLRSICAVDVRERGACVPSYVSSDEYSNVVS